MTRTPGLLHFETREDDDRPGEVAYSICCENDEVVAEVWGTDHGDASGHAECRANADRLIACFNALNGLNPEGVAEMVASLKSIKHLREGAGGCMAAKEIAAAALKKAGAR